MKPFFRNQNNKYFAYHKYEDTYGKFKVIKKMLNSRLRQLFKRKIDNEY
jgi:hypothetical protein